MAENVAQNLRESILLHMGVRTLEDLPSLHLSLIRNIYPFFQECINVRSLSLVWGHIAQIENLNTLSNLVELNLTGNHITDVRGLEGLINLQTLLLDGNPISALSKRSFHNLPRLRRLSMRGTQLSNLWSTLAALEVLPMLEELALNVPGSPSERGDGFVDVYQSESDDDEDNDGDGDGDGDDMETQTTTGDPMTDGREGAGVRGGHDLPGGEMPVHAALNEMMERERRTPVSMASEGDGEWAGAGEPADAALRRVQHVMQVANGPTGPRDESADDSMETDRPPVDLNGAPAPVAEMVDVPMAEARAAPAGGADDGFLDPDDAGDAAEDMEDDEELQNSVLCKQLHYREFFIFHLPRLRSLDDIFIVAMERRAAADVCRRHFETLPNMRLEVCALPLALTYRELGAGRPGASLCVGAGSGAARLDKRVSWRSGSSEQFRRDVTASRFPHFADPIITDLLPRRVQPRQFEYHPTRPELMAVGTVHGETMIFNHEENRILGQVTTAENHSLLGLCWLRTDPSKLIAGADRGAVMLMDVDFIRTRPERAVVYEYENFEKLTSVNVNCTDELFVTSGYAPDVGLYDLKSGRRVRLIKNLHDKHINVLKFAHHSPDLFATSSFDCDVKLWDIRQNIERTGPIYAKRSTRGNVMVCFSPDDRYLLASAVDNEVRQYEAADGRLNLLFNMRKTGSEQNYTRSYYMNGRDYVITGSCEEDSVRLYSALTGQFLSEVSLGHHARLAGHNGASCYVQSLRGDPHVDFRMTCLLAFNTAMPRNVIVKVDMMSSPAAGS